MKATDMVKQLQNAIEQYGDLEVGVFNDEICQYSEMPKITGKRKAEHDGAWFETDDESLGDEFIAFGGWKQEIDK